MDTNSFNTRQMQAYAALCLAAFCAKKCIKLSEVDLLISHLFDLLGAKNLPQWEQAGADLAITGRGDELPKQVEKAIPSEALEPFNSLVEYAAEVGLVDMNGAATEGPGFYLEKCVELISRHGIPLPPIDGLSRVNRGSPWGTALDADELSELRQYYGLSS